ncbi:GNAT family N-acetyltransferase [Pelagibius sp.]|uniref:GNAT family N-acetyltransferase n=1 Tax=Pelagibius sp. TaxID=1931238 RepID=UPI0026153D72|nr:GNAT family N-acetyltransferase [Pelagibius sp.]
MSVAETVETELLKALHAAQPQAENASFVLAARDPQGALVGGLTGTTSYGWLLVKTLWVDETQRGQGLGRALMDRAEERARQARCHGAWLDTSNPDAMAFYARLGYELFGELANTNGQQPTGHRRWFMRKTL